MLIPFLSGAVSAGFLIAGLFFLRFWKKICSFCALQQVGRFSSSRNFAPET